VALAVATAVLGVAVVEVPRKSNHQTFQWQFLVSLKLNDSKN
jgi:hypothetical protein